MRGRATIIGAGIAGLAAARALALEGWDVDVRESAPGLPGTGTVLGLWPAALEALEAIGAGPAVRGSSVRVEAAATTGLRTPAGKTLIATNGGGKLLLIRRPLLLEILADGVDITFGAEVAGPRAVDGADVVIGADGTNSRTRLAVFGGQYAARSLGAVAWRGTVEGAARSHGETWAPGALFGISPAGPDATNWYACLSAGQPFDPPHLQHLRDVFGSWRTGPAEVLKRVTEAGILHHELLEVPRLPSYSCGRVVLVGDAAHSMAPFLGRGACEALVDGVALGRSLGASASVADGLAGYDRARRVRTQRLVGISRLVGRTAMMPRGFRERNAILQAAGAVMGAAGSLRRR